MWLQPWNQKTLAPWKKSYDQPRQCIKKAETFITLSTKVCLVKAMFFPVVMYGCESWTIKKSERRRTDAFELSCWRRLLTVPWTARRSNQSILKEISSEYSLEGLMPRLKLQYFGHLMWRTDLLKKKKKMTYWERPWFWERLKAGGEGDDRGWDGWMASPTQWTMEFEQVPGTGDGHRSLACCSPWGPKDSDMTEQLNWIELHLESVLCNERPPQWRQGRVAPPPHNFRKPTQSNKDPAQPKIINV